MRDPELLKRPLESLTSGVHDPALSGYSRSQDIEVASFEEITQSVSPIVTEAPTVGRPVPAIETD